MYCNDYNTRRYREFRKEQTMIELENINAEISEYEEMITHSIQLNDKERLKMWRKALQTAKKHKRRLANS